jgi:hypothetical protein
MGWDGMVDEGGGGLEMRKWNGMDEMLGVVLALTARSSNIIFLVLIMQALHLPLGFGFRYWVPPCYDSSFAHPSE